jgi:protein-tyrosine phosphatase
MSRNTVARLRHHGISTDAYLRLPLDVAHQDFESADHVVAVKEAEHRPLIQTRFPSWLAKVEFWEVHDLDFAGPEEAIPHLECEVRGLMERLANGTTLL